MQLGRLFAPHSVAVVGASDDTSKYGGKCLQFLKGNGFRGHIWPVHPRQPTVQDLAAYTSLAALPGTPDVAIIAVPRDSVPGLLEQAGRIGVPFAILFSSGFGEAGAEGAWQQARVLEIANSHGMRILGPNCVGMIGCEARFVASFAGALSAPNLEPGNVALVSQSGAMMGSIYSLACEHGVRFRAAVNPGNESSLGVPEFMEYFADDPGTSVVMLLLEGIRDGERFAASAARLQRAGKRVLVLKSGRSETGREMALSHTANLAGDDAVFDAVVRRYGLLRAEGIRDVIDKALAISIAPYGNRSTVGIFSGSGGAAVLLADAAAELGLSMPQPGDATARAIREKLPHFASIGNPMDTTADLNRRIDDYLYCMEVFASDPAFGGVVAMRGQIELPRGEVIARGIARIKQRVAKPIVLFWPSDRSMDAIFNDLRREGVPVYSDPNAAMASLAALLPPPSYCPRARSSGSPRMQSPEARATNVWTEAKTKEWLRGKGLPVPNGRFIRHPSDLHRADDLHGPLAVKIQATSLVHKTEVGGVRLDVSRDELANCAEDLWQRACDILPEAELEGLLVEEMIPAAFELIVGVRRDPVFGWFLLLAPGGILAELFPPPKLALLPLQPRDIDTLLDGMPAGRMLSGFRGAQPVDRSVVRQFLHRLTSALVDGEVGSGLREFEANPVAVGRDGSLTILDATMIFAQEEEPVP